MKIKPGQQWRRKSASQQTVEILKKGKRIYWIGVLRFAVYDFIHMDQQGLFLDLCKLNEEDLMSKHTITCFDCGTEIEYENSRQIFAQGDSANIKCVYCGAVFLIKKVLPPTEVQVLYGRLCKTRQILIAEIGADGSKKAETLAREAVVLIQGLKAKVAKLYNANEALREGTNICPKCGSENTEIEGPNPLSGKRPGREWMECLDCDHGWIVV